MKSLSHSLLAAAIFSVLVSVSATAIAKLPALSDEAKAKAAEAAAKTAWAGKVDGYLLCKSQEKVAAGYFQKVKAGGTEAKPAAVTPPCADPGPFAYAAPEPAKAAEAAKPIEAAGAHSPATTAVSPPSTKQTDAVLNPASPAKKP